MGQAFLPAKLGAAARGGQSNGLNNRVPSLINASGVVAPDGASVGAPYFDENLPLRDGVPFAVRLEDGTCREIRSPVVDTLAIQQQLDKLEWLRMSAFAVAYAPHRHRAPLAGVPAKSVLVQFAKGDQSVPNPSTSQFLRAADLADRATFYRHDLAYAERPQLPTNPHPFTVSIGNTNWVDIALGA